MGYTWAWNKHGHRINTGMEYTQAQDKHGHGINMDMGYFTGTG